jgi:hypothetical protein
LPILEEIIKVGRGVGTCKGKCAHIKRASNYLLKDLGSTDIFESRVQPFRIRKTLGLQKVNIEDLTLIPCSQITKNSHNGVSWPKLLC